MRQPCRDGQRCSILGSLHWVSRSFTRWLQTHGRLWLRRHGRVASNLNGPIGDAPLSRPDAPVAGLAQLPLSAAPAGLRVAKATGRVPGSEAATLGTALLVAAASEVTLLDVD